MPKASRSALISLSSLAGVTRASAEALPVSSTTPVWQGRSRACCRSSTPWSYSRSRLRAADLDLGHPGPLALDGELGAILLGGQADRGRLDPHRQILGHQRDVATLRGVVEGNGQDARIVVAEPESGREDAGIGVVQLDVHRAAEIVGRDRGVQAAVGDPQIIQVPQRGTGEVAQLAVVPLGLQLGDHHHGEDDFVLGEAAQGLRVAEQDGGVDDVGAAEDAGDTRLPFSWWPDATCARRRHYVVAGQVADRAGSAFRARRLTVHASPPGRAASPRARTLTVRRDRVARKSHAASSSDRKLRET